LTLNGISFTKETLWGWTVPLQTIDYFFQTNDLYTLDNSELKQKLVDLMKNDAYAFQINTEEYIDLIITTLYDINDNEYTIEHESKPISAFFAKYRQNHYLK
jgi:hypothetical protein